MYIIIFGKTDILCSQRLLVSQSHIMQVSNETTIHLNYHFLYYLPCPLLSLTHQLIAKVRKSDTRIGPICQRVQTVECVASITTTSVES